MHFLNGEGNGRDPADSHKEVSWKRGGSSAVGRRTHSPLRKVLVEQKCRQLSSVGRVAARNFRIPQARDALELQGLKLRPAHIVKDMRHHMEGPQGGSVRDSSPEPGSLQLILFVPPLPLLLAAEGQKSVSLALVTLRLATA